MASIVRPTVLRQTGLLSSSRNTYSTKLSSTFPSITKPASQVVRNAFVRNAMPSSVRVAAFHASGSRMIFPALPQTITGTVNDAASVPHPSPTHGSYHWTFERLLSAGLVPLTIAPFAAGSLNPLTDAIFCATILLHSHIGFDALIVDYFPPKRFPRIRPFLNWGLRLATVVVGVGLYEFETNDVGLTEGIRRVWSA